MSHLKIRLAIAAPLLGALFAQTVAVTPPQRDGTIATVREYLDRATQLGFSGSVAITRAGVTEIDEGYGTVNCAGTARVTPETGFYVASLSKSFTAAAVLLLEEQGELRTSDSIERFFPDVPEDKSGLTIHHLLSHSSGLGELPRAVSDSISTREEFERAALSVSLQSPPGSAYRYSNLGYGLLAALVERASGQSFEAFLRLHIFERARLFNTRVATEPVDERVSARACNGGVDQGDAWVSHHRPYRFTEVGAVGIVTTAQDVSRWIHALNEGVVLRAETVERVFSPQAGPYGYGWLTGVHDGRRVISHDGLLLPEGWNAVAHYYPDEDTTVVVLSNTYDEEAVGWSVAANLRRLIFGGTVAFPPRSSGESLQRHAGVYTMDGGAFLVKPRGDGTVLEPVGQAAVNALLGVSEERARWLADATRRTDDLLSSLLQNDEAGVRAAIGGQAPVERAAAIEEFWRWLSERYGPAAKVEVLHAVPAPAGDRSAMVYAALHFERAAPIVRLVWDEGRFERMSDRGGFVGATPGVPPVPGPMRVVATGRRTFSGMRLTSGISVSGWFSETEQGCALLYLRAGPRTVTAKQNGWACTG